MKIIDVKQNTEAWYRERLGRPTASEFDKIITAAGNASDQRIRYIYQLIYERIYKQQANSIKPTVWMERGKKLESEAKLKFQEITGWRVESIGFVTTDDGKAGCSPDGTVWGNPHEGVEIKVPEPWRHIMYSVEGPVKEYKAQLQAQMYIAEFEKVHFFSYNPGMPCRVWTVLPDRDYIKSMAELLEKFLVDLEKRLELARRLGSYFRVEEFTGL